MPRITLIGYRGCGKTTVAAELSRLLECDWEDADAELERACGFTIAELIGVRGEQAFRDLETEILENLCGSPRSEEHTLNSSHSSVSRMPSSA